MANENVTPATPPMRETVLGIAASPGGFFTLALTLGFAIFVFWHIRKLKIGG